MTFFIFLFIFIFGAIIGSFLNVALFRYNTGRGTSGRSACLSCGTKLSSRDLVPIFSFLFSRGRCNYCGSAISWQYPAVELITGVVFAAIIYKQWFLIYSGFSTNFQSSIFDFQNLFVICYLLFVFSLLIAITVYDIRHKIIPNGLVWMFVFVSIVKALFLGDGGQLFIYDLLAGPILALFFAAIWFFSGGRAMGLGDAKLALGIGLLLGFFDGVSALLLSFWIGGLVGVFLLLVKRERFTMKSEIPFAPFLTISAFLVYFFQFDFFGIKDLFL